ncbi:hypothetical protein ACFOWZ_09050 [Lentzea rhizosphaerae]|uniref:Uncharacterized protein n=1 Tax=Lentzea rhizosphaerae TaxID=2041025 RepID=A0ABV8BN09_9PSEU
MKAQNVDISTLMFTEYVGSRNSRRIDIVKEQRSIHDAEDGVCRAFYQRMRDAMRRAANSPSPENELNTAIARANRRGQERAFTEIKAGFLPWFSGLKASGVRTRPSVLTVGELDLKVQPHLGLRLPDGTTWVVLAYLKEPVLQLDAANIALRILQRTVDETLPGAVPVVLDARRGKPFFESKRSRPDRLDPLIAAEAAGYVVHWRMAA